MARRFRGETSDEERYERFVAEVEPDLASRPRLHRFAAVPAPLDPEGRVEPLEVIVDTSGGGDVAATHGSIERQWMAPAGVVEGDGRELLARSVVPWALVVSAGDRLAAEALERLGQAAALAPDASLITCDDDVLDAEGRRHSPRCFPGPSPDLLRQRDVTGSVLVVATSRLSAGLPQHAAWRYDVAVHQAGPAGAGHAHLPLVLCHRGGGDSTWPLAPARRGLTPPLRGEPSVEAIVCFRDRAGLLERCTRSLLDGTAYDRLTLRLVDNGSEEVATADLLDRLQRDPRVTVRRDERAFNFAELNNAAAAESSADVLAFVNSDVEAVDPHWLEPLLAHAQREEVGAVGPLLLYPDGRVQHVGAVVGMHGWAGHPFAGLPPDRRTPFGAATDGVRNWLAVTAACLVVERRKFAAAGGFDEGFAVGGNDVDLGLRLTAAGHRTLCVPHVRLVHHESATRDPAAIPDGDFTRSAERYGEFRTVGDPFYNPSLTLAATDCGPRRPGE